MGDISKENNSIIITKETNNDDVKQENIYINYYSFDFSYEFITPILKDIQTMAQLIKLIVYNQISDIIFIKGNNSYSIHSRFYFRYQNIVDFYVKVIDVTETDYFTKLSFYIYKTKPKSIDFKVNFLIFNNECNSTKLNIEIILGNNHALSAKILKIINNEFKLNFLYLLQAIKTNKSQTYFFSSSIIKNEYFVLTKIMQNIKLIEYMIKGKLIKIEEKEKKNDKEKDLINQENKANENKENSFIRVNETFKISLNKKKEEEINDKLNSAIFKVLLIKIKEDKMIIQWKNILDNEQKENNINNPFINVITICIRKLTGNSCFMFIKYNWDLSLNKTIVNCIKNAITKCLINIDKLSKTAKHY